jgi:hypothetical protein
MLDYGLSNTTFEPPNLAFTLHKLDTFNLRVAIHLGIHVYLVQDNLGKEVLKRIKVLVEKEDSHTCLMEKTLHLICL